MFNESTKQCKNTTKHENPGEACDRVVPRASN